MKKREWYDNNKEHVLKQTAEYAKAHPEQRKAISRRWADKNKEYQLNYRRKWREANPELSRAQVSARRKKVRQATPPWADLKAITEFYLNCPEGHHVDHVIPLRGKLVSGLHTVENFQYLPAIENIKKGNKIALHEKTF